MQILGPNATESSAFIVLPGKQVTLSAQGLAGSDTVVIEIAYLSAAPEFKGDPCCDLQKSNIVVTSAVPLKCPDGTLVTMTAEYPFVVLDGPQLVTMRARLDADPDATVTVNLNESDSDGCTLCACRTKPCEDTDWTPTGVERCTATEVLIEEVSNCGTLRITTTRPLTWTPTGETRCKENITEAEETNDCGTPRWVATTIVCGFCASYPVPRDRCAGQAAYAYREGDVRDPDATVEIADCEGEFKVYAYAEAGPGHSVALTDCDGAIIGYGANTSVCAQNETVFVDLPCVDICKIPDLVVSKLPVVEIKKHLVEAIQVGNEVWTYWSDGTKQVEVLPAPPVPPVVYCPSMRISCDGQPGYGFHEMDPPDPLATVVMAPCAGDTSVDPIRIYPTAGPGHTVKVNNCDGTLKGYAVNKSDCAPDCGCPKDPVINVTNKFAPTTNVAAPNVTTNVAAPDVTVTLPAPNLVAHALSNTGVLTSTLSNGATVTSNPLPSC